MYFKMLLPTCKLCHRVRVVLPNFCHKVRVAGTALRIINEHPIVSLSNTAL